MSYYCYLLINENDHTYIGITNDLEGRLQKHNNGTGAKATKKSTEWRYHTIIGEFNNCSDASSFEWYWKHIQTQTGKWVHNYSGINNKTKRLNTLLAEERWNYVGVREF